MPDYIDALLKAIAAQGSKGVKLVHTGLEQIPGTSDYRSPDATARRVETRNADDHAAVVRALADEENTVAVADGDESARASLREKYRGTGMGASKKAGK